MIAGGQLVEQCLCTELHNYHLPRNYGDQYFQQSHPENIICSGKAGSLKVEHPGLEVLISNSRPRDSPADKCNLLLQLRPQGGTLERNLMGRCPFFKNLHNPFRKKIAFRYPVSELLDYKKIKKQQGKQ